MKLTAEARAKSDVVRFVRERFRPDLRWLIVSAALAVVNSGIFVLLISRLKPFVDSALGAKDLHAAAEFAVMLVVLFLLQGASSWGQRMAIRVSVERLICRLRTEVFSKLLVLSQNQSQSLTSGKAVNFILSDVFVIGAGLLVVADLIAQPIILIALLGYLFYLNWSLTLTCLLLVPLVAFFGKQVGGSARRNQIRLQSRLEDVSNHIVETLRGLRIAHAFGQTPRLRQEFEEQVDRSYRHVIKLCVLEESVGPTTKAITALGAGVIAIFGAYLVKEGHLTIGGLSAFFVAAGSLSQPLRTMNDVSVKLQTALAAASRLHAFVVAPLDSLGHDQRTALAAGATTAHFRHIALDQARLEMKNLGYRYPLRDGTVNLSGNSAGNSGGSSAGESAGEWALRDISFTLEPGTRIALVGASGAGKSTLSYMALRFLDPDEGSVQLAGRDARQWDLRDYRAAFSYVSQDVFLFNRTLRENLQFAAQNTSDDEIWQALERANIRQFVERLPDRLDTRLGEQAAKLSGGEKQRISIARAFLRDSPILILDEATSHLDTENERAVQRALNDLMKTRSAIIIAHRLSTIREVDEIFVMEKGRIIERGHPDVLLTREQGHFRALWATQRLE